MPYHINFGDTYLFLPICFYNLLLKFETFQTNIVFITRFTNPESSIFLLLFKMAISVFICCKVAISNEILVLTMVYQAHRDSGVIKKVKTCQRSL